jgi:Luciferase-like monooxygenase
VSGALRLGIALPGVAVPKLLEIGRAADFWNVGALWVGDPHGRAANANDNYVTAGAAALTAVTQDIRLGLFLGLRSERQVVRLAEDVAVVDQASGGRVDLALVPTGERAWVERAGRLLRAWSRWQLPGTDETVAVLPSPAQPVLPRFVVGDPAAADSLGAGLMTFGGDAPSDALVPPRRILVVEPDLSGGVEGWLSSGAHERVVELRQQVAAVGAQELVLVAPGNLSEADVKAIGTVLVPSLRASDRDVRAIANDSWVWLTKKHELHSPS